MLHVSPHPRRVWQLAGSAAGFPAQHLPSVPWRACSREHELFSHQVDEHVLGSRNVAASAKRGRRSKSETAAREASPVPVVEAPTAPLPPVAGRKSRGRPVRSNTAGVDHEGLVTLQMPSQVALEAELAREEYAEHQMEEEELRLHPDSLLGRTQQQQQPAQQQQAQFGAPAPLAPTMGSRGPELETGSYGVVSGLPEDSVEKTVLREQIGHDIYKPLRSDALEQPILPRKYQPVSGGMRELADLRFNLERMYWETRKAHREYVHDLGFEAHHLTRENSVNIYANTRRVAGLMAAFENDDFKLQNLAPSNIAPWARAEIVFYTEHERFNDMLRANIDELVKRPPKEAQEEELDLLDEALFLLRPDDDNATSARVSQQGAEQELLDKYLEGLLPGATLDNLSAAYAQDIFTSEMDEFVDEDALFEKGARTAQAGDEAAGKAEVGQDLGEEDDEAGDAM